MKATSFLLLALVNNASYGEILSFLQHDSSSSILSFEREKWGEKKPSVFLETVLKHLYSALPREIMVCFQIQSNLIVVTPNNIQRTKTSLELNE